MKRAGILAVAVVLSMLAPSWCAYAESRDAQVCYEVSATVIYVDGTTETVQRVSVGSVLKAPESKGAKDGRFIGWWNDESGSYWDFSVPIEGNMTLTARYAPSVSGEGAVSLEAPALADGQDTSAHLLLKTGDVLVSLVPLILLVGFLAAGLVCVSERFYRRK